jgi:formylglycine-generating enzyme required for sulfatase activity
MPDERAYLGKALALLGDDRPGVTTTISEAGEQSPSVEWIDVPAGEFLMGSGPELDPDAKPPEQPRHSVYVDAFRISKYPVTVAQYVTFVEDGGYEKPQYWSEVGLRWKTERSHPQIGWNDPRFHVPNQPIIGVTWFEAQAFCRWAGERLGFPVRLLSEAEWEKAARGVDGRIYPTGNELDAQACNTEATGLGQPCAVGIFPLNASPFGVCDMAGNVFEWTTSVFAPYPYDANDGREDQMRLASRIFRGGAYSLPLALSRCAYRSHFYPHACYDWVGFRIGADR